MDIFLSLAFTIIFSYLFGSLNSAIIVCRVLKHKDIRDYGSNNAGLTNVLRVFGKGPAAATLLCDLAKGVLAVVICPLSQRSAMTYISTSFHINLHIDTSYSITQFLTFCQPYEKHSTHIP